ncbi:hypothetical protein EG68_09746 [Paragonimus skrjabini miyazakii]|uniref:Uncharacterized protein n=1 Tax=Paragonimus skrjabini miyazakii TaxID=59628 RepID=A0A8S9YK36_9TREM|nr:hypothetical protein EG68_09746 [Paragonimus skrjabini miyazakii]
MRSRSALLNSPELKSVPFRARVRGLGKCLSVSKVRVPIRGKLSLYPEFWGRVPAALKTMRGTLNRLRARQHLKQKSSFPILSANILLIHSIQKAKSTEDILQTQLLLGQPTRAYILNWITRLPEERLRLLRKPDGWEKHNHSAVNFSENESDVVKESSAEKAVHYQTTSEYPIQASILQVTDVKGKPYSILLPGLHDSCILNSFSPVMISKFRVKFEYY